MTTTIDVAVLRDTDDAGFPGDGAFENWALAALGDRDGDFELGVRLVDEPTGRAINERYRGKDRSTNVLSFDAGLPPGLADELEREPLGDLVICVPVVTREAGERGIDVAHHCAHLVVHGVLHLLGHDHEAPADAERMEALETAILAGFGIADPYRA